MKSISRKILIPFLVLGAFACEPEVELFSELDQQDMQNLTSDEAISALLQNTYSNIIGTWGGHNSLWSDHEIASDEMVIAQKGGDWEDGGHWLRMHKHEYLPSEESFNNGWAYIYGAIANINLELQQRGEIPAVAAELRTLRAMLYLWLIDAWGNVPIIDETNTDETPDTKTRAEVYTFIENSILDNYDDLRDGPSYATMNKDVADAILAKLYLNAEVYTGTANWSGAAARCNNIINSGNYSLEPNFFDNFVTQNAGSSENIFVLNYDPVTGTGFNLAQMTLHYGSQATYNLQEQPWNGYATLEEFYNAYDDADDRKDGFIVGPQFASNGDPILDASYEDGSGPVTDPDGEQLNYTPEINMLAPNALRQSGARVGKWEFENGAGQSLANDFPIFRYADVLLMRAEALWNINNADAEALALVNEVRGRSNAPALVSLDADALLAERGFEMFAEGYRRSDLIRFDKYGEAWWEKAASDATKELFPIPTPQIEANTGLIQNQGY